MMTGRKGLSIQQTAVDKLKIYGLTESHFTGCDWFNSNIHILGLAYLMKAKHMPPSRSVNELKDLSSDQIEGLMKGIKKEELFGLSKFPIKAIHHLATWGVTNALLRDKQWFNSNTHFLLLKKLICEHLINPEKALDEMIDLNQEQMHTLLVNNFSIEEIQGLNKYQLSALCEYHTEGLTHLDLRDRPWFNTGIHVDTLHTLIHSLHVTPQEALNQMENLTPDQTLGIIIGHTRTDILALSPFQLQAIIHPKLGKKGPGQILPSQLIGKDWFNSQMHVDALVELILKGHNITSALEVMDNLTGKQISYILLGVSKEEAGDLNDFHLEAFQRLKSNGLKLAQLAGKPWFQKSHIEAMVEMVTIPPYISVEEALLILDDSDERWARKVLKAHAELPPNEKTEKFISIFYFKTLDKILKVTNDKDFKENKIKLELGLNNLQLDIQVLKDQQDIRREIAVRFVKKIKKNASLSVENKIALLEIATHHAVFGHINPLSSALSSAISLSRHYLPAKDWHSNTQKIFLEAIKELKTKAKGDDLVTSLKASS